MAVRKLTSMLASAALLACCVSCGDSGDGTEEKNDLSLGNPLAAQTSVLDGDYAPVNAGFINDSYKNGIDAGFNAAITNTKSTKLDLLHFSNGSFEFFFNVKSDYPPVYRGKYTIENGKIILTYEQFKSGEFDISIYDDIPEPVTDTNGKKGKNTKKSSNEELVKIRNKRKQDEMKLLNESGTFYNPVCPRMFNVDKNISYSQFPWFKGVYGINRNSEKDPPEMIYSVDDCICTPTYGFDKCSGYRSGMPFTLSFDAMAAMMDDPGSIYNRRLSNGDSNVTPFLNHIKTEFNQSTDTTIEFADGKWTWKNGAGEIVNNGYYLESSRYKGIIGMFTDENSTKSINAESKVQKRTAEQFNKLCPLLFYIAGDGTIWYPNWVKMN